MSFRPDLFTFLKVQKSPLGKVCFDASSFVFHARKTAEEMRPLEKRVRNHVRLITLSSGASHVTNTLRRLPHFSIFKFNQLFLSKLTPGCQADSFSQSSNFAQFEASLNCSCQTILCSVNTESIHKNHFCFLQIDYSNYLRKHFSFSQIKCTHL